MVNIKALRDIKTSIYILSVTFFYCPGKGQFNTISSPNLQFDNKAFTPSAGDSRYLFICLLVCLLIQFIVWLKHT